jgi:mono/diheme cytochrome c family protein
MDSSLDLDARPEGHPRWPNCVALLRIPHHAFDHTFVETSSVPAAPAGQASQAAPAGNAETGKKLWTSVGCWQCHGYEGQGGAAGPRLAPRPLPWAALRGYVRRPANQMPYTERSCRIRTSRTCTLISSRARRRRRTFRCSRNERLQKLGVLSK